ncbi:hypothetical protein [Bacillus sp. FJAT-45037]|uniref:hypothetical protein n=1 Tax=Bacillus sp. FJAT-45037 TaxID=2011007 RepID=UPI0012FDE64E|nr:hypothetical protein [Bacillus sp. FJAT-45037]
MSQLSPNIRILIVVFALFLAIAVPAFYYFNSIAPLVRERENAENQLVIEKQLLQSVTERVESQETFFTHLYSTDLQDEVPVAPLVDQFLLDLEKAELFSESLITNYNFSTSLFTGRQLLEVNQEISNEDVPRETIEPEEVEVELTDQAVDTTPTNVEKVSAELQVVSPTYMEMMEFLKEIEGLKRIVSIDSLRFSGHDEIRTLDQPTDDLQYVVEVSAYYLPTLDGLLDELPRYEHLQPSNKLNPLYNEKIVNTSDE